MTDRASWSESLRLIRELPSLLRAGRKVDLVLLFAWLRYSLTAAPECCFARRRALTGESGGAIPFASMQQRGYVRFALAALPRIAEARVSSGSPGADAAAWERYCRMRTREPGTRYGNRIGATSKCALRRDRSNYFTFSVGAKPPRGPPCSSHDDRALHERMDVAVVGVATRLAHADRL
jgi:hypothetical protein